VANARAAEYRPWESVIGQIYLGGEEFCEKMQKLVGAKPRSREHPRAQRRFVRPTLDAVLLAVMSEFGETEELLRRRSHLPARKALAHLATERAGLTYAAAGEWMHLTGAAISHLVRCSREAEGRGGEYRVTLRVVRRQLAGM
jgi:hypothetical protein